MRRLTAWDRSMIWIIHLARSISIRFDHFWWDESYVTNCLGVKSFIFWSSLSIHESQVLNFEVCVSPRFEIRESRNENKLENTLKHSTSFCQIRIRTQCESRWKHKSMINNRQVSSKLYQKNWIKVMKTTCWSPCLQVLTKKKEYSISK